jgi:hypothetical protein
MAVLKQMITADVANIIYIKIFFIPSYYNKTGCIYILNKIL